MTLAIGYEGSDFPARIERAVTRAMNPSLEITHSERVALATLILRAEAKDGTQDFWVRRINLADLFGRVERTVTNWLTALESKGFIRKEQGRTRWGNFSCLTVQLTTEASRYLGLYEDAPPVSPRKKNSPGYIGSYQEQSLQRHLQDDENFSNEKPKTSQDASAKVPEDCKPLLDLGISVPGVFKLMGEASKKGKRLGPIVATRLSSIAAATKKYAYLLSLARDGVDYSYFLNSPKQSSNKSELSDGKITDEINNVKHCYDKSWIEPKSNIRFFMRRDTCADRYEKSSDGRWNFKYTVSGEDLIKLWKRISTDLPPKVAPYLNPSAFAT